MKYQYKKSLQFVSALTAILVGLTAIRPAQAASWVTTGSLGTARYLHTATLLPGGNVLVAGGDTGAGIANSVELYNPSSGTWTPATPMNIARYNHTATLLPNGKVLVVGGIVTGGSTNKAELYDSSLNTWTLIAPMTTNRSFHSATLLPSGLVLISGGFSGNPPVTLDALNSAELYDPTAGTWTNTGSLNMQRGYHQAALLPNGQVLIAGGSDSAENTLSSAELFTPSSGQWTMTGAMNSPRAGFAALMLTNGKFLVAGGQIIRDSAMNTAELYNPATGNWISTTAMANVRADNTAILLPSGSALLVDGWNNTSDTPTSEIYNPTTGTWSTAATFNSPRFYITATLLHNGKVLAAGGLNSNSALFSKAQLYDTGSGIIAPPTTVSINKLPNTPPHLAFTSRYGSVFSVIATGNLTAPLSDWPVIGVATETSPGQFQFTDPQATNLAQRFYRLRSP